MTGTRFSTWLKEQLKQEDLNYTSLAHLVDVNPNTARAWCIGQSTPEPERVLQLARVLHADPQVMHRLLGWLPQDGELKNDASERLARKISQLLPAHRQVVESLVDQLEARQREAQGRSVGPEE